MIKKIRNRIFNRTRHLNQVPQKLVPLEYESLTGADRLNQALAELLELLDSPNYNKDSGKFTMQ